MEKKKMETMDLEQIDVLLRQKMMEEADRYEREINSDPTLAHIKPSPRVFENIMAAIEKEEAEAESAATAEAITVPADRRPEDFLSEADRRALELGRKQMAHPVRRRVLRLVGIAAAMMVGVFGASMTIEANREKLMNVINILVAKESVARLDNDDTNRIINIDERDARADIEEKLGVSPIEFMYMPQDMVFDNYVVDEITGNAMLFYQYKDTIIFSRMESREYGASQGGSRDGEIADIFEIQTDYGNVRITEIQGPNEKDYLAELSYENCFYSIYGILPKEEFIKMIEKIKIF